jgi:hypothetical protein
MRELELAVHPLLDTGRSPRIGDRVRFPLSRAAFVLSIAVHVIAVYALSRQVWPGADPQPSPVAEFFLFELPPPPAPSAPIPAPEQPPPEIRERPARATAPVTPPAPVSPPQQATAPIAEPSAAVEPSAEPPPPAPVIDFEQARQRAADEIVTERSAEQEYLTFSIDDVAPPRPVVEPDPKRSIFDDGPSFGSRSVLQPGQARTKLGRKLLDFCNALTGGFGVAFQGFGLFSACAQPDDEPSGLFPEVRPAYLDLLPECVETRDTAPQLARESPFPTIKCRLVKQVAQEQP